MPDYGNIPFRYRPSNLAAIPYSPDWFKAQGWQQTTSPIDLTKWGGTGQVAAGLWFDPSKFPALSHLGESTTPNASNVPAAQQAWMAKFGVGFGNNPPPTGYDSWWNYWNRPESLSRLGAGGAGSASAQTTAAVPQSNQTTPPLTGSPFQIMQQAQAATTPQLPQFPNYSGFQFNQQQAQRPFRGTGGPRQASSYFQT